MTDVTDLRIVVAEDHDIVRAGLTSLLNAIEGLSVVGEARNGEEACRLAAELEPDVLLMDLSMPVLDGLRATERVTEESPAVAVLALTMHDDLRRLQQLLTAGAAGYVLKRADPDELVRAIRAVAAGRTYVDPELAGALLRNGNNNAAESLAAGHPRLSEREEAVLRRTAWGETNKRIADDLGISTKTVETYKARIAQKLGIAGRAEMVRYAVSRGWMKQD